MDCVLDKSVQVGANVTIEPFAVVKGNTILQDGCVVGSFSYIQDATIGQNTVIKSSRIISSSVGANCTVGPNAHLRDNAVVGDNCRIGNFVEIKNSTLERGVKASHLAYIGDAFVGKNTNIGCGVIFVNYDGKCKHKTTVGKNCFIGCNTNLVAPLTVGDNCFVACGTTVDKDIPSGTFGIGRSYLVLKEGRAIQYLKKPTE
jgi:bifunctional UDP-N-acetylglucosamine pyrophosphorylase/glucosamine-1-phosphate N-acetyltransferase